MFTIGIIKNPTFAMALTTKRTRTNTRPSPLPPPVLYEEYRSTVRRGFQYFPESTGVLSARDWMFTRTGNDKRPTSAHRLLAHPFGRQKSLLPRPAQF